MRLGALALLVVAQLAAADEAVRMEEKFPVGARHKVRVRVELTGSLKPPPGKGKPAEPVRIEGSSSIDYEERILSQSGGVINRSLRLCERFEMKRSIAGKQQQLALRPEVRRLVVLRKGHTESAFSPDGPLYWGELDVVRTDVFIPALTGLLPSRAVRPGEVWQASGASVQELTDLEKVEAGGMDLRLERIVKDGKRRLAKVQLSGTVKGVGEDGTASHKLQGLYHFDLDEGYLADLVLNGEMSLLDKDGKEAGKVEGRFVMVRTPGGSAEGLSDEAVRKLKTEPDEENTRILYDNPDAGVRFLYPRAWRLTREMGNQYALDGPEGEGVLITLDSPGKTPTARQLKEEARQWVEKQKGAVLREQDSVTLRASPRLDWFGLEARMGGDAFWMDYYVTVQEAGGATLAARSRHASLKQSRKDTSMIAGSISIQAPRKK
jgi:hypothetical protein